MQFAKFVKTAEDAGIPLVLSYRLAPNDGVLLRPDLRPDEIVPLVQVGCLESATEECTPWLLMRVIHRHCDSHLRVLITRLSGSLP